MNYGNGPVPQQNNDGASWALIVIMFIFIWPVGLFLLLRKLNGNRAARLNDGKAPIILGSFLLLLGLAALQGNSALATLFYLGGGGVLLYYGINMRKTSQRYRQYIDIVVNRHVTDIRTIANMTGVPAETCMGDLQKMIDRGYFPNGYIDIGGGRIVMQNHRQAPPPVQAMPQQQPNAANYAAPAVQAGPRVVQCKGCGANNTVYAGYAECEYCGGPLS